MSELRSAWTRLKLPHGRSATLAEARPHQLVPEIVPEMAPEQQQKDDDSSSASSASSTGTVVPSSHRQLFSRPQRIIRGHGIDPIPWTTFFERELFLPHPSGAVLHAYLTSPSDLGPLFVAHHGAGSSGLSFALLATEIRKRLPTAGVLSLDARGHGGTTTAAAGDAPGGAAVDLSLDGLTADLLFAIRAARDAMGWAQLPALVLVGHSLGGAVVVQAAHAAAPAGLGAALLGYVVLDVVEGSALDALQSMTSYLSARPAGFASPQAAIDWHLCSRTLRNPLSARVSVPDLLVRPAAEAGPAPGADAAAASARPLWRWKTDLAGTQPFWQGWFAGLSGKFLTGRGGKMLLLAGTDRLDTELTIGQMQGKYSMHVFPDAGHFIHEDLPDKTAATLMDFYRRNDRSLLVLPPKVSELVKQGKV